MDITTLRIIMNEKRYFSSLIRFYLFFLYNLFIPIIVPFIIARYYCKYMNSEYINKHR